MFEAPLPGKHHRNVRFIAGFDGLIIIAGAARLDDTGNTLRNTDIHTISKWKECIAHHGGADEPAFFCGNFLVEIRQLFRILHIVIGCAVFLETISVSKFPIGFIPCNFSDPHPVLLAGPDADRYEILHINY